MNNRPAAAVAAVEAELDKALLEAERLWQGTESDIVEGTGLTHRLIAKAQALHLKFVAELDGRGIPEAQGALHTANWLRHTLNRTPGEAKATASLVTALAGAHSPVGDALAAGTLGWEQARAIVRSMELLPDGLDPEHVSFARDLMLDRASVLNSNDLLALGRAIRRHADPDGTQPEEEAVAKVRGVTYRIHGDGSETLVWRDSVENVGLAKAAIAALEAPKPAEDGTKDPRTTAQRRADALAEIFGQVLRHGDLPTSRGVAPHLHVTVDLATLTGQSGATLAALATGSALTRDAVRRLACDADITPIVLDAHGVPLSVGRTYRSVTPAIWAALVARDGGCVFDGCAAPPSHCRAHHVAYWENLGETSLENGALLCEPHHVMVHHRGWQVRIGEDGIPELIPPTWIDSDQKPRRNAYWRIQRELLRPPDLRE